MATGGETQEGKPSLELPFDMLSKITNSFSDDRKLGASLFGTLYKGTMDDGKVIAVKKLNIYPELLEGKTFNEDVKQIMLLKHDNIVQLVGYCSEVQNNVTREIDGKFVKVDVTESLVCYEYLPNGILEDYLFGTKADQDFDWDTRFKIVKGICQGLLFLHSLDRPIIHMDLNNKSVWLGENMVPKIGNFGLSRLQGLEHTKSYTKIVVGSYGYMAPEYRSEGVISAQADIYSFGVMIIEISTGEKNIRVENQPSGSGYINKIRREWTAEHIASKFPSYDAESLQQVYGCIEIGLECVELDRKKRPTIQVIVDRLNAI